MKRIFLSVVLALVLASPVIAQDATYLDSLQASGVTNTNTHTQGFAAFVKLRSDFNNYQRRTIVMYGYNTTDSVKLQGAILNKTRDVPDTQWVDLQLTEVIGPSTNNWAQGGRDTAYIWFSNVGKVAAQGTAHYTASPAFSVPYGYDLYRVCTGKNDSGKVYIRSMLWEGDYGYMSPGTQFFAPMPRYAPDAAACYFEHQRA